MIGRILLQTFSWEVSKIGTDKNGNEYHSIWSETSERGRGRGEKEAKDQVMGRMEIRRGECDERES